MIIRKQFKFEAAHRVRSSTGSRCKNSIHGHSYIVEILLRGSDPSADMVIDFGDLKDIIGEWMDSLDHTTFIWKEDDIGYIQAIRMFSRRVVRMDNDPTAENMAKAIFSKVDWFLSTSSWVEVSSVRVHETATGYAEAFTYGSSDNIVLEHDNDD